MTNEGSTYNRHAYRINLFSELWSHVAVLPSCHCFGKVKNQKLKLSFWCFTSSSSPVGRHVASKFESWNNVQFYKQIISRFVMKISWDVKVSIFSALTCAEVGGHYDDLSSPGCANKSTNARSAAAAMNYAWKVSDFSAPSTHLFIGPFLTPISRRNERAGNGMRCIT